MDLWFLRYETRRDKNLREVGTAKISWSMMKGFACLILWDLYKKNIINII